MSGRNSKNNEEFRKYRDVAPESVDDNTLRQIIADNNGNHDNIAAVLDRLWTDVDNVPDWTVNSKSKKGQDNNNQKKPQSKQDRNREKVANKPKDRSVRPAAVASSSSTVPPASAPSKPVAVASAPKYVNPVKSAESWPKSAAISAAAAPAWGSGGSLADKIKRKEEEDRLAALAAKAVESVVISEVEQDTKESVEDAVAPEQSAEPVHESKPAKKTRGRGPRQSKSHENVATEPSEVESAPIDPVESVSVVAEPAQVLEPEFIAVVESNVTPTVETDPIVENTDVPVAIQENLQSGITAPFLKLGRWESTPESVTGDLQFGSFGNFKDEGAAAASQASAWGAEATQDARNVDTNWTANAQNVNIASAPLNSYFPQGKGLSGPSASFDATKTNAPPGLDNQGLKANSQAPQPNSQYYQQPPGIVNPVGRGMPVMNQYQYGFDLSQSPFMHPGFQPIAAPAPNAIGSNAVSSTAPTSSSSSTNSQQQTQQQAQPQAQPFSAPPGMTPYFYSPYFPNQYFYNQPGAMQNYYSQGRGYPGRPYPSDHYGSGGPMYPDIYSQGQFGDAASTYGNLPIHPSMPLAGQGNIAPGANLGAAAGKQSKGTGPVGSAQQSSGTTQDQAASQHAPYGYAPYGRNDQWQFQSTGQGWAMPFSTPASSLPTQNSNAGFNQAGSVGAVSGAQSQQGNNSTAGGQRTGSGNAYGAAGSFASGGRNSNGGSAW